jgi:hypothetical protein
MVVTAIKAGPFFHHTTMLGQPERRVKHKVCQFVRIGGFRTSAQVLQPLKGISQMLLNIFIAERYVG